MRISGLVTTNSSDKSRSETRHKPKTQSLLPSLLIMWDALWRPSFGSVCCDMCHGTVLNLRRGLDRILRHIRLKGRNLVAGPSGKAGLTLPTLGSSVQYMFPRVAGCRSFSFLTSGFSSSLPTTWHDYKQLQVSFFSRYGHLALVDTMMSGVCMTLDLPLGSTVTV